MSVTRRIWICFTLVAVLGGCKKGENAPPTSQPSTSAQVRVAAAADLQFALADLVRSFEQNHPDIRVSVTYGSSGNFFSQLSNKAPFDLFLSADAAYPQKLVEQGLAQPAALFDYATGKIVLWAPKNSAIDVKTLGMGTLTDQRVRRIAIANPDHAPYGRAAVSALKSANIYDRIKDRLVLGENIAQTAQFAASGSADVGIIALSLALSPQMIEKGNYFEIPNDSYPPIQQAGVILNTAADPHAAQLLRDDLTSDAGRAVLARFGFATPSR